MNEMRGVSMQQTSLAQRLQNKRNITLLKVADTAVDEFRAAARRSLCKIVGFEEDGAQASRGGIHGCAETSRPAANDDHIPLPFEFKSPEKLVTIHGGYIDDFPEHRYC